MAEKQVKAFIIIFWQEIKTVAIKLVKSPVFYIYLVAVVIYLPWFLPNLSDIAPWDETYYVLSGRNLLSGQVPDLASGPLLSLFYLICSLPVLNSPFWLVHANSLGRFLLFTAVFVGTWQVAKVFKDRFQPVILFGFLFITPFLTQNFEYPADLLFAALSAIAFSQAVRFVKTKQLSFVWRSSFWLGLGMLTRGDALIIILALTLFVVWFGFKHHRWWRLVLAALLPFLALSLGYVLVRGAFTGDFNTGMSQRSYTAFEQGQEAALPEEGGRFAAPTESYYVARELFGTPEENEYSVFKAIRRNPQAYFTRLWAVVKTLPGLYLTAYNERFAIVLALLAFRGLIQLFLEKKLALAFLHMVWILPIIAGIARTLVRVGYFRLFYFVLFSLAIIGLQALLESLKLKSWEGLLWVGLLGLILTVAFFFNRDRIQMSMTVFLCWLLLAYLLATRGDKTPGWQNMAMLLLLASAYLLRTGEIIYEPRTLGVDPREAAALALRDVTDPDDTVLTCTPSVVFLADRPLANFCGADIPEFDNSDAFIDWMRGQSFDAIYLDQASPIVLKELVLDQSGNALQQVFRSGDHEAFIYLLKQVE
jgi:hypothetical protein